MVSTRFVILKEPSHTFTTFNLPVVSFSLPIKPVVFDPPNSLYPEYGFTYTVGASLVEGEESNINQEKYQLSKERDVKVKLGLP